jgi:hypothetical protein
MQCGWANYHFVGLSLGAAADGIRADPERTSMIQLRLVLPGCLWGSQGPKHGSSPKAGWKKIKFKSLSIASCLITFICWPSYDYPLA